MQPSQSCLQLSSDYVDVITTDYCENSGAFTNHRTPPISYVNSNDRNFRAKAADHAMQNMNDETECTSHMHIYSERRLMHVLHLVGILLKMALETLIINRRTNNWL